MSHLKDSYWSGLIGAVVSAHYKKTPYLRSRPAHFHDRKSEAQLIQRSKLSLCHAFLKLFMPIIRLGYAHFHAECSAYQTAISQLLRQACSVQNGVVQLQYEHILLGQGSLAIAQEVQLTLAADVLTWQWQPLCGGGNGHATDVMLCAVYNQTRHLGVQLFTSVHRSDGVFVQHLPTEWGTECLHCFMGFLNVESTANSNIVHVGQCN